MKVGSLCTGYGGGDRAVEEHFQAETVWVSDIDKHANTIIDQRFPGLPNLGDLTKINWHEIEPVDVLVAGFPCQPFSQAGKQKGVKDERHIWPDIARGISVLRPGWVVLENVRGAVRLALAAQLKALGNGVVPQQMALALQHLAKERG